MVFDTSLGADATSLEADATSLEADAEGGWTADTKTSPAKTFPAKTSAGKTSAGKTFSDQRRLQRLCEWRALAWKAKNLARAGHAGDAAARDGAEPKEEVAAHRRWLVSQAEQAGADFWGHLAGLAAPPGAHFVPFFGSKLFTAAECLACPLQEASRRWFRWLSQIRAVERAVARATKRGRSWGDMWTRISRIHAGFESAEYAWRMHLGFYHVHVAPERAAEGETRGAGEESVEAPTDWLAAWAAAEIGEAFLRPLMARASPEAGPERLRHELLLEIWAVVLSLPAGRLTVPAFCGLPATVAGAVRVLHTDAADHVDRLKPETRRLLLSPDAPDPQAVLLGAERLETLQRHVRALPPQQQRAVELAAEGRSRRETAHALGCSEETAKTHLERARTRLRAELRDEPGLEASQGGAGYG